MSRKRNVNGGGTKPRRRPDGRWEGRVTVGRNPATGRLISKSVYGKTATECQKKMVALINEVNEGTYTEPSKLTVAQWLDIWQANYLSGIKQSTEAQYKGHIKNHIVPALGKVKLVSLHPHTVQTFYMKLLKNESNPSGLSAKSVKNVHAVLNRAMEQAVELRYIKDNPTKACKLPSVAKKEVAYLENDAVKALMTAIEGHKYESLYMIDLFTGLRQGELLGLTWDCVDFEKGVLLINKQLYHEKKVGGRYLLAPCKTNKTRRIVPAKAVMECLKKQRQKQKEAQLLAGANWNNEMGLVFTNEVGRYLRANDVYEKFKKIVRDIGLPSVRFHDLRHTFVMLSLQNGDDIKTVQQNVGHSSAAFTLNVYGHASQQMQQESANRMQSYFDELTSAAK